MGVTSKIADTLFPYIPKCAGCGVEKEAENGFCPSCREEMDKLRHGATSAMNLPAFSCYDYDGMAMRIVRGYKYSGKKYMHKLLAYEMAQGLKETGWKPGAVCHVPLHMRRTKERGFDQAELLAREIAQITGLPFAPAIRRVRYTKTQTKLSEAERRANMDGAFEGTMPVGGGVLLVDDVLTTGATAAECAKVLQQNGAANVYIVTYARAVFGGRKRSWLRRILGRLV